MSDPEYAHQNQPEPAALLAPRHPAEWRDVRYDRTMSITQVVSLRVRTPAGQLAFFSTTTIFGTPVDITLDELATETFFPADATTASSRSSSCLATVTEGHHQKIG